MTTELTMLIMSVGLLMLILAIQGSAGVISNGLLTQAGPRDGLPEQQVFHARVTRLRANMMENLLLFAPVVLVAQVAGIGNELTVLGAQLFFFGRLGHGIIYLAGWPFVRPLFFAIAWAGIIMIATQLFT
jgi:uncharacterized MAPEG superfamily protein